MTDDLRFSDYCQEPYNTLHAHDELCNFRNPRCRAIAGGFDPKTLDVTDESGTTVAAALLEAGLATGLGKLPEQIAELAFKPSEVAGAFSKKHQGPKRWDQEQGCSRRRKPCDCYGSAMKRMCADELLSIRTGLCG